ncbi:MAG: hypothetical protein HDQ88_04810 [Clostridia bacterium]|nr:hypothetical protein [Clostridia bacterium]
METYIYDLEIYRNFFSLSAIPYKTPQDVIDIYIKMDLAKNKEAKQDILKAIGAKTFYIYRYVSNDTNPATPFPMYDDSKNYSAGITQILQFFKVHKTLIGYNSYNYDMTMLDIFIHYAPSFDPRTGLRIDANGNKKHITEFMYEHSQKCIAETDGWIYRKMLDFYKGRRYYRPFTDFDIQKILYLDKSKTALKAVMIVLKWYRIQDLPIHYSHLIRPKDIENVLDYNMNDVLGTDCLVKNQQAELDLRAELSDLFNIDLRNMSRSSIGKSLMTKFYSEKSGLQPHEFIDLRTERSSVPIHKIIKSNIKFQTPFYQTILDELHKHSIRIGLGTPKRSEIKEEKITPYIKVRTWKKSFQNIEFISNDKGYTLATGGLHSKDDPKIIWANPGEALADPDVNSMYPSFIINYAVCPHHLVPSIFLGIVKWLTETRLEAKHTGQKHKANGLKIVINRIYGALKDAMDYLYDPECTFTVTINLQLLLCNLIERFELAGFDVLSANTDGLLIRRPFARLDEFNSITKDWEEYSKLTLETEVFEKYCRSAVNSYIAVGYGFYDAVQEWNRCGRYVTKKGKECTTLDKIEAEFIKYKGDFLQEVEYNKGFEYPVVKIALKNYLLYNTDISEFIHSYIHSNPKAIYDYCFSQKVNHKYTTVYRTIQDGKPVALKLQKHNRFYICNSGGGSVVKAVIERSDEFQYGDDLSKYPMFEETSLVAGEKVMVFNDYELKDDYNINFGFYINEANKVLYGNGKTGKGAKLGINNNSNNLFGW